MLQTAFASKLNVLAGYLAEHGHLRIPDTPETHSLHAAWTSLRWSYSYGALSPAHYDALVGAGLLPHIDPRQRVDAIGLRRMEMLEAFVAKNPGRLPSHLSANETEGAIGRWLQRLGREYRGGAANPWLVSRLEALGIRLDRADPSRLKSGRTQEQNSFDRKRGELSRYLDEVMRRTGCRDLVRAECVKTAEGVACYRFLEHMIFKARNGTLPAEHDEALDRLRFSVNGRPVWCLLRSDSTRAMPGGARGRKIFGIHALPEPGEVTRPARGAARRG